MVLRWLMVSPCLLIAIKTISGKLGSEVCWKEIYEDKWENTLFRKEMKVWMCAAACVEMTYGSGHLFILCLTYFHFKECTAERWPAVHRLQEGHFGLLDGHACLFIVGGNDKLKNTHIIHKYMRRQVASWHCSTSCAALNEVNNSPPEPSGSFSQNWEPNH